MLKIRFKELMGSLVKVLKEHRDPHEIALGAAIGSFIAIIPLYGLHTVLCLVALFFIPRANKLAILLGASISIPPTVPIITWTAYDIGRIVLFDKHYLPLSWEYFRNFKIEKVSEFYYPLFIGSVILGLIVASVLYGVSWIIANRIIKRHVISK